MQGTIEPSPLEFLQDVESGEDVKLALRKWQKRRTDTLRLVELKRSLFGKEQYSSGSLRSSAVMRAIEKQVCKPKFRSIRLVPFPAYEVDTQVILCSTQDYHVVIEKERPFSLEIADSQRSTLALMETACLGCFDVKKQWPTCLLIKKERFYGLEWEMKYFHIGSCTIPFDCAPDDAGYDVMAIYDEVGHEDAWMRDRKD